MMALGVCKCSEMMQAKHCAPGVSSRSTALPHALGHHPAICRHRRRPTPFTPVSDAFSRAVRTNAWLKWPSAPKVQDNGRPVQTSRGAKQDAADVIRRYYDAYNKQDYATMEAMLAPDVEWHDMALYDEPFKGRDNVMDFKRRISQALPDFMFVIDDISTNDPYKVGVMWHTEVIPGVQFPFSRGCSFYTVNDQGQIQTGRDVVEATSKAGDGGITALKALVGLLRPLGENMDPKNWDRLPTKAALWWAFYALYAGNVFFNPDLPGSVVYDQPPEVMQEVFNESLNFFYINIGMNQLGINFVPSPPGPPPTEAVFNFMAAWGLLFLPVMLTENKSKQVKNGFSWWLGVMFLTNVFFIPFLALRAAPASAPADTPSTPSSQQQASTSRNGSITAAGDSDGLSSSVGGYPGWSTSVAAVGLGVGLFSIGWFVAGRPEFGDLSARWDYFLNDITTNRVSFAFILDAALYGVWQAILLGNVPSATPAERYVPFFGLAAHLLRAPKGARVRASEVQ